MKTLITAICLMLSPLAFADTYPEMDTFNFVASNPEDVSVITSEVTAIQKIVLGRQLAYGKLLKITKLGITGVRNVLVAHGGTDRNRCHYLFRVDYEFVDGTQSFSYSNTGTPALELKPCLGVTEVKQH